MKTRPVNFSSLFNTTPRQLAIGLALASVLVFSGPMSGCQRWKNRKKPVPKAQISAPSVIRDIPSSLRGTVGAEAQIRGVEQTLVSGIGFVVGLNGTGGLTIPEQYAAHLEREMGRNGVTIANDQENSRIANMSPRQLLKDRNTAAVIIQAAIPAGSQAGESFDVYVRAINATSLEGGRLWTTEMRIGPPSAFGDPQARILGNAKGPIFINPFAEPGGSFDGISRNIGRILDGGVVTFPTKIEIILDNPSHQRARQIASAINSAFPAPRGLTARGKDESLILVQIPSEYQDRRQDFINLISHVTIDQSFPEVYARKYATTLLAEPYLAGDMSWCLQALGERSIPFLNDLYNHPEAAPRLAALRAGASLGDSRVIRPLRDIALDTSSRYRTDAMELLSSLDRSPMVDNTLRQLLSSPDFSVRIEAYESLMERALRARRARLVHAYNTNSPGNMVSNTQLDALSKVWVPMDPVRGVGRSIVDGKFFLDVVPFGDPMIYVTQQKEPRIVLFGDQLSLEKPLLASAWSDRLMLIAEDSSSPIRLYYRDDVTMTRSTMNDAPGEIAELVQLLAHTPTPEDPSPGLGMSYSQVVGALYHISNDKGIPAAFTTEEDRLLADLLSSVKTEEVTMRPESDQASAVVVPMDDPTAPVVNQAPPTSRRRTLLVPVTPTAQEEPADTSAQDPAQEPAEQPAGRPEG